MSLQRFQCTFARTESSGRSVAEIRSEPVTVSIRSIEFHRAQGFRQFQTAHLQPGGVSGGNPGDGGITGICEKFSRHPPSIRFCHTGADLVNIQRFQSPCIIQSAGPFRRRIHFQRIRSITENNGKNVVRIQPLRSGVGDLFSGASVKLPGKSVALNMAGHTVEDIVRKFPADPPDRFQRTFLDNAQLFQNDQGTSVGKSCRGGTAFCDGIFPLAFAPWRMLKPAGRAGVEKTAGNSFMKIGNTGGYKHMGVKLRKAVSAPFGKVAAFRRSTENNGTLSTSPDRGTDRASGPQKIAQ